MRRWSVVAFTLLMLLLVAGHMAPHEQWMDQHESNNAAGAWLVGRGQVVYRDFFSHHPPFAYWYAAPAVRILGAQTASCRWALMLYYVLALAAVYAANRRSSQPIAFAFLVILLTLAHVRYSGHLYLADHLFAFAALVAFCKFWQFDEDNALAWRDWLVIGLAMFAAIGSTLVAAYPLLLLALGLAVKHFRYETRRHRLARAVAIAAVVALPFLLAGAYLLATGSLGHLREQVFRSSILYYRTATGYASWAPSISPLGFFVENIGRRAVFLVESLLLRHGALEAVLAWSNVSLAAVLAARRRWIAALFYLGYVLLLMLRMDYFHQSPYVVQSLWAAAWLLQPLGERLADLWRGLRKATVAEPATSRDLLQAAAASVILVVLSHAYMGGILAYRQVEPRESEIARLCARLTMPGDRIAVLPASPEIYMQANRLPAVPSFSYYRWQDLSPGLLGRMVESFENQRAKLLVINWWTPPTGPHSFRAYGEEIRDAIRSNYQPISIGAPRLYARNASYHELLGRYERVRTRPIIEVPKRNLVAVPVFGPTALTQFFSLDDTVSSARLEVLLSASARSDSWADIELGYVAEDGKEHILAHERFRTARVRFYPGFSDRAHWYRLGLGEACPLVPRKRYFFRISSLVSATPDSLQVMTSPRCTTADVGETLYGRRALGRTACFRLLGRGQRKWPSRYPVIEQSLARKTIAAVGVRQTLTMPEATTVSAMAVLLGAGPPSATPSLYSLKVSADGRRTVAEHTFSPEPGERHWRSFEFPPVFVQAGERVTLTIGPVSSTTSPSLRLWTAGCDMLWGGDLSVAGRKIEDDLCVRLYEVGPRRAALPDIAVLSLDFSPAAPAIVSPRAAIRLSVQLENRGTSQTGPFWVEFFALPKDFLGPVAFAADSLRVENLEPGETWRRTITRSLYPLQDGLYSLVVVADRPDSVVESNEENNRFSLDAKSLLVVARTTDANLYIEGFEAGPWRLRRGQTIELRGLVSNNGKEPVGRFQIEIWAARDPANRAGRFPICDPIVVSRLAPNEIIDLLDYSRTLRDQMPTGRLYIGCTVDSRDEVLETREWDNTAHFGPVLIKP